MAGALLTLFNSMVASTYLSPTVFPGITQLYGEENLIAQRDAPSIVWVPRDSSFKAPAYIGDGAGSPRVIFAGWEKIEAHLWGASLSPTAQPQEHADAVEALRQGVLQALIAQMWTGYDFRPVGGQWVTAAQERQRNGRAYVLLVVARVPITMPPDVEANIKTVAINPVVVPPGG